jgi:hypothetical protein
VAGPVYVALALLLVLAVVAAAAAFARRRRPAHAPVRVLAEATAPPPTITGDVDPVAALDALLAEVEATTVRIGGADELDADAVRELERLAAMLEAAAESFAATP